MNKVVSVEMETTKIRNSDRVKDHVKQMEDVEMAESYNLIYELNAMDSKQNHEIIFDFNHTKVIQSAAITDKEILPLLDYVVQNYQLSQKDFIAFGLVAQHKKLLSTQLTNLLQLAEEDRLRSYIAQLVKQNILITRGVKKSNEFLINPELIANSRVNINTTLKTIEPYRLMALIEEDVRSHPDCSLKSIEQRLWENSHEKDIFTFCGNDVAECSKRIFSGDSEIQRFWLTVRRPIGRLFRLGQLFEHKNSFCCISIFCYLKLFKILCLSSFSLSFL